MPSHQSTSDGAKVGDQIGGYRLLSRLGDGSTSTVFLGEHVKLGRRSAIKVLANDFRDDAKTVERLLTEARVVNDIRHPNIVDISDFVEQASPHRVALVMEHIEGPSLKQFRGAPLPVTSGLAIAIQLVDAVQAAHARGVIHRDIKPDNLLLTVDPREHPDRALELKVVDFGIAKIQGPQAQGMTMSGTMLGTPAYMAPEQIAGSPAPSAATDVFALGAVLYELLSGERVYPSTRLQETVRAKLRGQIPPLRPLSVPNADEIAAVVRRCLDRHPNARPSLDEVRQVLERTLRRAVGENMTDALDLPTLGLTSAGPLPAPAATELSEVPEGVVQALLQEQAGTSEDKALPELVALLQAQDVDDEDDEVGTELARSSLQLPALEHSTTEQVLPDMPAWATHLNDVATAMGGTGIPDHASSPTNRVLNGLEANVTEGPEPHTAPADGYLQGLMGPAGVPPPGPDSDHRTATAPNLAALPMGVVPLEARAAAGTDVEAPTMPLDDVADFADVLAKKSAQPRAATRGSSVRPDQLFASGVGLQPDLVPEAGSASNERAAPSGTRPAGPSAAVTWGLRAAVLLLLAGCVVGGAFLGGVIELPREAAPASETTRAAPVAAPPVTPPSATPR